MIGAEIKATSSRDKSLPIIGPGKKGTGLKYHQLNALAGLAEAGGISRLIWCNEGDIGVLASEDILVAYRVYEQAMQSEASNKDAARGAKSIQWERFKPCNYTAIAMPNWLGL